MDPKKITELANLLRTSGDKVLSSEFKLTLSGTLLRALNDSFTLIADQSELCLPQSFQVVKPNNSKSEVFRDLQLVHDFVQKTLLLCITQFPGDEYFEGIIDITKFRNLKRLEVQKINIKQIVGLQPLRTQLQQIICTRSLEAVEDVITRCGGDKSNGFVWNELKIADFSYNNLTNVDFSLEFAQYLQILNLSHNQLVSVEAIKWLPNLKTLDLSYNQLVIVPSFHVETSKRMQILNLSNNFIEDLLGISKLDALTELNLADNCLLDHTYLVPLSALITLKYLNLYGNPLYCHPKHRLATAEYLHKNTSTVKFILDFESLTKSEKNLTGKNSNALLNSVARLKTNGLATPNRSSVSLTPSSSVGSLRSFRLNESDQSDAMNSSVRKLKVRRVDIEDSPKMLTNQPVITVQVASPIEGNKDHLETKKQIEDLRQKYGAAWLQSDNTQTVLGINDSSADDKLKSNRIFEDFVNEFSTNLDIDTNESIMTSTPVDKSKHFDLSAQIESPIMLAVNANQSLGVTSQASLYVSAMEDGVAEEEEENITNYESIDENFEVGHNLDEIYTNNYHEPEASDAEDNEVTYIVYAKDSTDEIFLTVSDVSIKEKDALTRITKAKWSLKILESCDRINSNTLRINFDTLRKNKRERVYTVEEGLCQELEKYLRGILSNRALSEMNQTIYRCVNCSSQFSRENTYKHTKDINCPECKSAFVAEVHEHHKPIVENKIPTAQPLPPADGISKSVEIGTDTISTIAPSPPKAVQKSSSGEKLLSNEESASHSSIGKGPTSRLFANNQLSSAGSLNESSSCSKISNSESSFDSNQSVAGSSANDRDNDFRSNCDSDVEILSNPSQSSIEVLDQPFSSRKTSEERRVSQIPYLETIQDQIQQIYQDTGLEVDTDMGFSEPVELTHNETITPSSTAAANTNGDKKTLLGTVNLTESSSSGSVTDSICTAYEQNDGTDNKKTRREESVISSMLGGLFQSTNMLMSRSSKQTDATIPNSPHKCEKFKFNYSDFSDVDHRLKLYFYQKFEDESEHFKWIVKGKVHNETNGMLTEGIIAMTTTKFYMMEIIGPENDNIAKWLRQTFSVTVDRLEEIGLLPWKIGLSFKIKGWGGFLLILQDILRTDGLLLYFANNSLPDQCYLEYQISEKVLKKLSTTANNEQLKMFSLLNQCEINSDNIIKAFTPSGFFTTDSRLYLTTTNCGWLSTSADLPIDVGLTQMMSNLVEVERPSQNVFLISFLDDMQDKSELWKCTFETKENADSCLNAIGQSWEKLFGVPLLSN